MDSFPPVQPIWIFEEKILLVKKETLRRQVSTSTIGLYLCQVNHQHFGLFNRTIRVAFQGSSFFLFSFFPSLIEMFRTTGIPRRTTDETFVRLGWRTSFLDLFRFFGSSRSSQSSLFSLSPLSISVSFSVKEVFWSRSGEMKIVSRTEKYNFIENRTDRFIRLELILLRVSLDDQGEYLCTANNQFGTSKHPFQLQVQHFKPFFLRQQSTFFFVGTLAGGSTLFLLLLYLCLFRHRTNKSSLPTPTPSILNQSLLQQQQQQVKPSFLVHFSSFTL